MAKKNHSHQMSVLVVCPDKHEGNMVRLTLEELLGHNVKKIGVVKSGEPALEYIKEHHPEVLVLIGISAGHSEAIVLETRVLDGVRHTGIIVIPPKDVNYDSVAIINLEAGADVVLPAGSSLALVRLNMLSLVNQKLEADEMRRTIFKHQNMNLIDELTGLANMRGFLAKFAKSFEKCRDGSTGLALIMMDLDHFKKVNDSTNHMVGSFVIKSVGHLIAQQIGQQIGSATVGGNSLDVAARFGGDEFIIALHGDDVKNLLTRAEILRGIVENQVFKFQGFSIRVTCSQGLCWVPPSFDGQATDIVKGADAMLYKAKDRGRNTIVGMNLWYPVDFNHIGGTHMIDWDTGSDDNRVPRRNKA